MYRKEHTNSRFNLVLKKDLGKNKGSSRFVVTVAQKDELVSYMTLKMTLKDAKTFRDFLNKYLDEAMNFNGTEA